MPDATGTPSTNFLLPKYNPDIDAPSGLGFNTMVDDLDSKLKTKVPNHLITGLGVNDVPVWNGTTWVRASGTPTASTFLRGDGQWAAIGSTTISVGTALPVSPSNGDKFILTNSTTAPTYQWLLQYDTSISGSSKWRFLGGNPLTSLGMIAFTTNGFVDIASLTTPTTGTYYVDARAYASNAAVGPDPKYVENGIDVVPVNFGTNTSRTLVFVENRALTASWILKVQAKANGTDQTAVHGMVSIIPVLLT